MNDYTPSHVNRVCFIYALIDPRNQEIRYIGKTVQTPSTRLSRHISRAEQSQRTHVCSWIKSLLNAGFKPHVEILETVSGDGCEAERYWIAFGTEQGWRLTNHTSGGEGLLGYSPSEKTRRLMRAAQLARVDNTERQRRSAAVKQQWKTPSIRAKRIKGLHARIETGEFSESNRQAQLIRWSDPKKRTEQSKRMQAALSTPEARSKISQRMKDYLQSEDARQVWSEAQKKRYEDPDQRIKTGETTKQMWERPEYREKQSASRKALWSDPEYKAKMSEARKRGWKKRKAKTDGTNSESAGET